jgi:hypothetical protein
MFLLADLGRTQPTVEHSGSSGLELAGVLRVIGLKMVFYK